MDRYPRDSFTLATKLNAFLMAPNEKAAKQQFFKSLERTGAIRFAASLDGIITVLSGMSNTEQMKDNLSYMKNFKPLDAEEQKTIWEAQRLLGNAAKIPCTACHYCTEGCPKQIPIPEIFKTMNSYLGNGQLDAAQQEYGKTVAEGHRAEDCIGCKQCEKACPQHLQITKYLEDCAETLKQ